MYTAVIFNVNHGRVLMNSHKPYIFWVDLLFQFLGLDGISKKYGD